MFSKKRTVNYYGRWRIQEDIRLLALACRLSICAVGITVLRNINKLRMTASTYTPVSSCTKSGSL